METIESPLDANNEPATEPPIMICEACEGIQHPESPVKQRIDLNIISFYMLEEATRKGCRFCRIILAGVNFFQHVFDRSDESKPGLVLDAIEIVPQQEYAAFTLRALS